MTNGPKSFIPSWKRWIIHRLGLGKHLYLGPEGVERALRDKLHLGKQLERQALQQSHPDCIACPLWREKHTGPIILTPQDEALRNLIGTKTLPTLTGEMARKYSKLHQEGTG